MSAADKSYVCGTTRHPLRYATVGEVLDEAVRPLGRTRSGRGARPGRPLELSAAGGGRRSVRRRALEAGPPTRRPSRGLIPQ